MFEGLHISLKPNPCKKAGIWTKERSLFKQQHFLCLMCIGKLVMHIFKSIRNTKTFTPPNSIQWNLIQNYVVNIITSFKDFYQKISLMIHFCYIIQGFQEIHSNYYTIIKYQSISKWKELFARLYHLSAYKTREIYGFNMHVS